MSIFKNLERMVFPQLLNLDRVVAARLFNKPNNLVYTSCFRPVFLEDSAEDNIEYLHSSKALLNTIDQLQSLQNGSSKKLIESELKWLNDQTTNYQTKIQQYVKKNGLLTGEGIGNLYYGAEKLGFSAEWLEKWVHSEIPRKCKYMTRVNLLDTLKGLKKYHPNSPFISQVEQQLSKRPEGSLEYVSFQANQTLKFQYDQNIVSNNPLVYVAKKNKSALIYHILSALIRFHSGRYVLHSE